MSDAVHWQGLDAEASANGIVAWVNGNGGQARYEPPYNGDSYYEPPRIAVLTRNGWADCKPGQWIIKGGGLFQYSTGCELVTRREFAVSASHTRGEG